MKPPIPGRPALTQHENRTVRHPLVFRRVEVLEATDLTPHMRRIVVGGPELEGFHSASPDDHVKVFFPNADGEFVTPTLGPDGPVFPEGKAPSPARDYTPRHHDAEANSLAIDFVLHGDGPASNWAAAAKPGDRLAFGGPRGSFLVAPDFDHYVLVGDESALPAIARWLEEMPAGQKAIVLIEVPEEGDQQALATRAEADITWLPRNGGHPALGTLLEDALAGVSPAGDAFWWIACESARARRMRIALSEERGVPKDWIRATGYWKHAG